jgi:ribosome maturation factor RimP
MDKRKKISGILLGIENGIVSIECEKERIDLPFPSIKRAKLCYEF